MCIFLVEHLKVISSFLNRYLTKVFMGLTYHWLFISSSATKLNSSEIGLNSVSNSITWCMGFHIYQPNQTHFKISFATILFASSNITSSSPLQKMQNISFCFILKVPCSTFISILHNFFSTEYIFNHFNLLN